MGQEIVIQPGPRTAPPASLEIRGSLLARNTGLNLAGQVIPLLVGVVTMPYVIRHLGPDRFGLLSIAWVVVSYFALFDLGIGPATTKFVAELLGRGRTQDLPGLVWTALATQSGFGLLAGLLLAASSPVLVHHLLKIPPGLQADALWVFLTLAASFAISFATGSLGGVLAASQRFDLLNAISIPSNALYYILPVGALALGCRLPTIVLLLVLSRVAGLAAHAFFCLRLYPVLGHGCTFTPSLVRPLLGFGGWVTVTGAVNPFLIYIDRFLIGSALSIAAVGSYTPPYMISTKLGILPLSLAATLFPAFSTSAARGDSVWISRALVRSLKYLVLIIGPAALVLAFFARSILTLWLGARFAAEGTQVMQILAVGVFFNSLAQVPSNLLRGLGRPDLPAKFHVFELPLHVGLTWLLVTRFGLVGAALACSVRVTLDFLLLITAACWLTRTPARALASTDLRRAAGALMALAAGFCVLWASTHVFVTDAIFTLLLGGGFLLAAWRYVLDTEERCRIRLWLKVGC